MRLLSCRPFVTVPFALFQGIVDHADFFARTGLEEFEVVESEAGRDAGEQVE